MSEHVDETNREEWATSILDSAESAADQRHGRTEPRFGSVGESPLEQQRRAHQFITQETRHYILLALLGHPHHMASLDELEYLVPKNRSTLHEHLGQLQEKGIATKFTTENNAQNEPSEFWGFTEFGIELTYEYNMLRYVPVLRVVQDNLYLTDQIERHRDASRPELPEAVDAVFDVEDTPDMPDEFLPENQEELMANARLFDAPPIKADPELETAEDADRPIDELF